MKKQLLLIIILISVAAITFFLLRSGPAAGDPDLTPEQLGNLPECGSDMSLFSVSPIAPEDYSAITPLGNMNPPSGHVLPADHMYMHVRTTDPNNKESIPVEVQVYSPGDVWLLRVDKVEVYSPIEYSDYTLFFAPCREVAAEYHHLTTISKKILDELVNPKCYRRLDQTYCVYDVKVVLEAGEIIGTAGGKREKSRALDLQTYDFRAEDAELINKDRFTESRLHMVCPLDYFTDPVKSELYSNIAGVFGQHESNQTNNELCGEFVHDKPGTIQGGWVRKGMNIVYNENGAIALAHDNINSSRPVISVGWEALPTIDASLLTYDKKDHGTVNRDFSDVTNDGNVYCFEHLENMLERQAMTFSLLLQVTGDSTIKIAKITSASCGPGPWIMPSDATEFDR